MQAIPLPSRAWPTVMLTNALVTCITTAPHEPACHPVGNPTATTMRMLHHTETTIIPDNMIGTITLTE